MPHQGQRVATAKQSPLEAVFIFRIRDGKIVEQWRYPWDLEAMLALGATVVPAERQLR